MVLCSLKSVHFLQFLEFTFVCRIECCVECGMEIAFPKLCEHLQTCKTWVLLLCSLLVYPCVKVVGTQLLVRCPYSALHDIQCKYNICNVAPKRRRGGCSTLSPSNFPLMWLWSEHVLSTYMDLPLAWKYCTCMCILDNPSSQSYANDNFVPPLESIDEVHYLIKYACSTYSLVCN